MRILNSHIDIDSFLADVGRTRNALLMLDYDGTLAPFVIDRDKAFPYPGIRSLLTALLETDHTRVILVTGRAVKDLIPLLGLERLPEIWGSHGRERLTPDGTYRLTPVDKGAAEGLARARELLSRKGLVEQMEEKPASVALHTRGMEENSAKEIHGRILAQWSPIAREKGLLVHEFDGGLELRIPGIDKGFAVATLLKETGRTATAYMGDDLTDEDAFRAIKGRGLGVLARPEFRPTAADIWLRPPEEVIEFLDSWLEASGGER